MTSNIRSGQHTASPTATSLIEPPENIPSSYLLAPVGETRVTANLPLEIELTLAVPTQVNGAGLDMDVHQVVNDPALDVILDPVDQEPPTNVDDFDERKLPRESTARMRGMPTGKAENHTQPPQNSLVRYLSQYNHPAKRISCRLFSTGSR